MGWSDLIMCKRITTFTHGLLDWAYSSCDTPHRPQVQIHSIEPQNNLITRLNGMYEITYLFFLSFEQFQSVTLSLKHEIWQVLNAIDQLLLHMWDVQYLIVYGNSSR